MVNIEIRIYFEIIQRLSVNNMIKKIDIAGIQVDNYTVRESIMLVEKNISRQIFTTLEEVNMQMLLLAETDERMRESLEKLDYSVIAETNRAVISAGLVIAPPTTRANAPASNAFFACSG